MQQVFNPLLLYFQLVHFYNNAEKKRKRFRGKTPAFFLGVFFKKRLLFRQRRADRRTNQFFAERSAVLFGSRRAATTRKMQKEEFTTRTTRGQRENIY